MDEHMGRRTVGGLLFTKGGSILLFREDSSRRKDGACRSRLGCTGTRPSAAADKGRQMHRAPPPAPPPEATPPPRRPQLLKNPSREPPPPPPPQGSRNAASSYCSETDNRPRDAPGRDLLARLKDRVSASRKRSLARESLNSPSSPGGFSASSSSSSTTRSASRPAHRAAASRIRRAEEGASASASASASAGGRRRGGGDGARRSSERNRDDELLLAEQVAGEQGLGEGYLSGFLARYRSSVRGGLLPSLEDGTEDSSGYWRFDVEGTEELENYFMLSDRHRGMRMDIDGMSYEELLALGDQIGTVNTGLSEDALSKCLNRSMYMPTASESHQDCDRKCSVCQEEYLAGEELGKMACKHYYHISCIQHWLRQKNWCPICKTVALKTK